MRIKGSIVAMQLGFWSKLDAKALSKGVEDIGIWQIKDEPQDERGNR